MTEAERIDFIINALEGGNGSAFAQRIGISTPSASKMRRGIFSIRLKIDAILKAYPSINRTWLETGAGYPGDLTVDIVKAHYEEKIARKERMIDHLMRRIEELEGRIETNS
jgi:hypothetical protein